MDEARRKMIIAEIENWRKNNLLPEHYCIFLLNLYSSGEHPIAPASPGRHVSRGSGDASGPETAAASGWTGGMRYDASGSSPLVVSGKMLFSWLLGATVIAAIILLAFHFNDFAPLMQIAIFAAFSLFFYILSFVLRRRNQGLTHLALGLSFLILTAGGIYMVSKLGLGTAGLLSYITLVCLLWCGNGLLFGFTYYLYCGILGLGIMYGFATLERVSSPYSWVTVELYWVPLAALMVGLGFLLHQRNSRIAGTLAICGMLCFFGAEIQSLYIPRAKHDVIQLLLFVKVFLSSALFFFTRRYWFNWLRL